MNKVILTLVLMLFWQISQAVESEYQISIDGLACPYCSYGIEKQLSKLDGVIDLKTDVKNGHVTLIVKEGSSLNEGSVRKAVEKAGFTLREIRLISKDK